MKTITTLSTIIFLLCHALYANAEDTTGYEVEMIIYEDVNARYQHSEDWSYNDNLQKTLATRQEEKKRIIDPEYAPLDWDSGILATKSKHLENNSNYKILIKKRWKQTGLGREQTFNIEINSLLKNAADETEPDTTPSYISGNVKLIMSRYLHFNIDLEYFKPQASLESESTYRKYPVVDERRMKSRETHYIDHPLIGVIVHATPYKIAGKQEPAKPAEYKTL